MNWILKNKNKNSRALVVAFFLVAFYIFFGNTKTADASCTCQIKKADGSLFETPAAANTGPTEADCNVTCLSWGGAGNNASYAWNGGAFKLATAQSSVSGIIASAGGGNLQTGNVNKMESVKVDPDKDNIFIKGIKYVLIGVLNVVGWLFSIAATLFAWVVEPANISGEGTGVLQKQAVKDVWIMVRDLLNMTFILILLFAAFCTIFQVEKWNLKKVWLNILINALLVNFSYPIARFFIDVSNVAFYYFINNLFTSASGTVTGSGIFAMFGAASGIGEILKPESYANYEVAYLVTMIIMLFIMGMTLLIIAALFVVRLVALTMLVMFSPIGFVGYIFPTTASFADKWWKNLFSYSFFAPIMIFGMAISLKITEAIGKENMRSFKLAASNNAPTDQTSFIANAAFMVIPIVVLWATIGVAKSMGIAGADKVVDNVKKGGKWLASSPWAAAKFAAKTTGVTGGIKQKWDNVAKGFKSSRESREARIAAMGPFKDKGAMEKDMKRRAEEYKKDNLSENELKDKAAMGDVAAAYRLADDKNIDQKTYDKFMATKPNASIMPAFNSKVKQTRRDLVAVHNADNVTAAKIDEIQKSHASRNNWTKVQVQQYMIDQEIGKMSAEDWNTQSWGDIADANDARVFGAVHDAYGNLQDPAKIEVRKRLSGNNAGTLNNRMNVPL